MARKRVVRTKGNLKERLLRYGQKGIEDYADSEMEDAESRVQKMKHMREKAKSSKNLQALGVLKRGVQTATAIAGAAALGLKGANWYRDRKIRRRKG